MSIVGSHVLLIGREQNMPPIGTVGVVIGCDDAGGRLDWEVEFPDYPCPVPPDITWFCDPQWLVKIEPRNTQKSAQLGAAMK